MNDDEKMLNLTTQATIIFSGLILIMALSGCVNNGSINKNHAINSHHSKPIPKAMVIDHYTVFDDGTAIDNDTHMMWSRCSLGQTWHGKTCIGEAKEYTWDEAVDAVEQLNTENYLGYNNWQLPHIEDLDNLRHCSSGFEDTKTIPTKVGGIKEVQGWCQCLTCHIPTINQLVFPNTQNSFYWSSISANNEVSAWGVNFTFGSDDYVNKKYLSAPVRVIRVVE